MDQTTPTQTGPAHASMFDAYRARVGQHDEMIGPDGQPLSHWRTFIDLLDGIGAEQLSGRWEEARRLIHENGVTYNVYGDPRGMDRPWELDPIPVMISSPEWDRLEAALVQRARLLEAILTDLYGPQRLLREGLVPVELVLANPTFLRPCWNLKVPQGRYLHLYAADLGRATDGSLRVINDRTQAPSGAGYALENRIVLTRTLPDVFRACNVQRLAMFFRTLRETLASLAPQHKDNPCVALLTPGPLNETYFEHAYLARYLGYTLVEGGDLTVRDDCLFLKTLNGLRQVDVLLRRLDAEFCDPLELRGDSFLGVAGLAHAARLGNLTVCNALGSSLAESAGLLPFLPSLCRTLLSEDLMLNSVGTWWCGDAQGLSYTRQHLRELVIKSAFPTASVEPVFGDQLSENQREELLRKIEARPHEFVAQERLPLATTPALSGLEAEPRHLMVRTYVAASPGGFTVMPGGLARFGVTSAERVVSMQRGGGSKDVWIQSPGPVSTYSLLTPAAERVELSRGGGELPSRVADNLYWLGRYVERSESLIRLCRGIFVRLTEQTGLDADTELPCLLRAATHVTRSYPGFVAKDARQLLRDPENELLALVFDDNKPGSVRSTLAEAKRAASTVRDRLSQDTWRALSSLDQEFSGHGPGTRQVSLVDTLPLLNRSVLTLSALSGLVMESMTRGLGWTFLDMGRRIERAVQTANLLRCTMVYPPASEGPVLEAVLEIADSVMTYRRRYLASLQPHAVLDLLLSDPTNPRSIAYCLGAVSDHLRTLPGEAQLPAKRTDQRLVLSLLTTLQLAAVEELCEPDAERMRGQLDDLLDRLYIEMPALSDAISHVYLSHIITSRQLIQGVPRP
jgi:uncharacterized circularly permuted ATP-grasp superfamily protein/uncharacterized alpha-E superfamily protein